MRSQTGRVAIRVLVIVALAGAAWPAIGTASAGRSAARETLRDLVPEKALGAAIEVSPQGGSRVFAPGDELRITGLIYELDAARLGRPAAAVPATFYLQVETAAGDVRGPYGPFVADRGAPGRIDETLPAEATAAVTADASTGYRTTLAVRVVDTVFEDPATGRWAAADAGAAAAQVDTEPNKVVLENSFVSEVGWVKPGESYPARVFVRNFTKNKAKDSVVTITPANGMRFTDVSTAQGNATISGGSITWKAGDVASETDAGPGTHTLVVVARADTVKEDPKIVWKNLSTTAKLRFDGGSDSSKSHGPKVIPPDEVYDTARYGDRPFPVVPVDYFDRAHEDAHTGEVLAEKINSKKVVGSTFNLYQEMSLGQLYPEGTVPSSAIATADFNVEWDNPKYSNGFDFTDLQPKSTCTGATVGDSWGSPIYNERISDGWYQIPGTTGYYGADSNGTALTGAVVGVGALQDIDSACGPTGKAVYDAAHIADPEINYSDFDTDKDGVVDFFMMVFVGEGGNGVSQTSVPPYDNIWPHSSTLEASYVDEATGLAGYISDDQLRDLEGRKLYYKNDTYTQMTTKKTDLPVYVRVGPYNVNPESSIDFASVISHEYGHSLGLPDFYSTGSRATYGDWNLMATDKSQNMDIFSKQELGWIVPDVLKKGTTTVKGWRDSKKNTHRIEWQTPDGNKYVLDGKKVDNAEAYVAKLPPRFVIDADELKEASPVHAWWSGSGNSFGCSPLGGHNLDIDLRGLGDVAPGTPVTLTFKTNFVIEWDYDYGFVLTSGDAGATWLSHPSDNGFTTPAAFNPNAVPCQTTYGNGITGSTASWVAGTETVDRVLGNYPDATFVEDSYDLSELAGRETILRFSYSTDVGLAKPGWFIDDVKVTAGDEVVYESNFEDDGGPEDPQIFNGGCKEDLGGFCTAGWSYVSSAQGSPADHAYYMEMRDRSGFDLNGHGENDRDPISFQPGLLLTYTDENHGYGNAGTDDPPAQSPLDSRPAPGDNTPNLNDAAFKAVEGRTSFSDAGDGWTDNYEDPEPEPCTPEQKEQGECTPDTDEEWDFNWNCLTLDVVAMSGDDNGPETAPGDLKGDVRFKITEGCAKFDYGHEKKGGGGGGAVRCRGHRNLEGNHIVGTGDRDVLKGTPKRDIICGRGGNDKLVGKDGKDVIFGGKGDDTLKGSGGADRLKGGDGDDTLKGGAGGDRLKGGNGRDSLHGGKGGDKINGGNGADTCSGGAGDDKTDGCKKEEKATAAVRFF